MGQPRDDERKAREVAEIDQLVMDESMTIADAAREMRQRSVSSVLIQSTGVQEPIGIVTERDILYRVVAEHRSPFKTTLKEIMSSPLITIAESASAKDAIMLMRANGIRRLPTTREGKIVGLLTLKSVMGNSHEKSIELLDVELPSVIMCPYCQSKFETKQDLSKHIDRLHLGTGLLEGDLRQW